MTNRIIRSGQPNRPAAPAFTLIEMLVVIGIVVLGIMILLPAMGKPRVNYRYMKDATQVRNVVQAMITFANSNGEKYPLPSLLDKDNATLACAKGEEEAKDNTGNILSILVFNGSVSTELCINPAESNTAQIVKDDKYEFSSPTASPAAARDKALWDPGFSGTPIDAGPGAAQRRRLDATLGAANVGHQSYAHLTPRGGRLAAWSNTFNTTEAVFGNRGPVFAETKGVANWKYTLAPGATGVGSNTLLIHGGKNTWEGNIGYNDGHVAFETNGATEGVTYPSATGNSRSSPDNLFIDEDDETDAKGKPVAAAERKNNFLRPIGSVPGLGGAFTQGSGAGSNYWVD